MTNHNSVNNAEIRNVIIQNSGRTGKSNDEVGQSLYDWGQHFDRGSGTFDIKDGMSLNDFKESLRGTFNGTDEEFEQGFSIFEQVFDSNEDGNFDISELSMLGLATGDDADGVTFWRAFWTGEIRDIGSSPQARAESLISSNPDMSLDDLIALAEINDKTLAAELKARKAREEQQAEATGPKTLTEEQQDQYARLNMSWEQIETFLTAEGYSEDTIAIVKEKYEARQLLLAAGEGEQDEDQ